MLSKAERDSFLGHAAENHEKNDITKEHMRESRKALIKSNNKQVQLERSRKEQDAAIISEKRAERESQSTPRVRRYTSLPYLRTPRFSSYPCGTYR